MNATTTSGGRRSSSHDPFAEFPTEQARTTRTRRARPRRSFGSVLVGVIGEVLITAGVFLALFLVWQLWWTDVVAGREQQQVAEELGFTRVEGPVGPERYDDPPVLDEPDDLTTFGSLLVPRWGEDYNQVITQGVGHDVLDVLGLGHYPGTAMPGGVGNFAVAGHRVTYGRPLNRVEELRVGDPLIVRTDEVWYVFTVTDTQVVLPPQIEVIAPVPNEPDAEPTQRFMTLTTCHPMFSARERFIVHSELDHWMYVEDGIPAALDRGE
ncbi:class E sortase [Cellulomonas bogoriensis]|uniref:Sortase n=1 Tax=Cellulomonas bogoriensis 69B4 = DSM 16987 TaxID=1386082 RepID=A0A0A0BYH4_9CELL|nr:class E sortase [Cellulomonas bogoriensis]KGM13020.1 sortase [Cellulomonas bogoriensis 69B4 = DSM 16987]